MATYSLIVQVMFSPPTWTTITPYVRTDSGITINRGRGDEQDEIQAGTASLTLNNDGRFTPGLATGAYYPNVKKGRRIRIGVVVSAVTYWRFDGYVNEWPVAWEGGTAQSVVSITCTDLFRRLGLVAPMRSLLEEEMLALDPDVYYTLGEPEGSTSAGDTSGAGWRSMKIAQDQPAKGAGNTTLTFGGGEGPAVDSLPAAQFLTGNQFAVGYAGEGQHLEAPIPSGTSGYVIGIWFNKDGPQAEPQEEWTLFTLADATKTPDSNPDRDAVQFSVGVHGIKGTIRATLQLYAQSDAALNISDTDFETEYPDMDYFDKANHFVAVCVTGSGGISVWVDGELSTLTFNWPNSIRVNFYRRLLVGGGMGGSGYSTMFDGTLSHVWYKRTSTMPDWANVWETGSKVTVPILDRFNRLCTLLGLTGTVLGTTETEIDAQTAGGKAPVEALQDVASVEGGIVYASRSSNAIVLECRSHRFNKAVSITLTAGDVQNDLTWSDDDQPLKNDVTFQREEGAAQRVVNWDSVDEYGFCVDSDTQPWATDSDALAAAQWAVYKGADPPARVTQVTVIANALASHTSILGLEISDVIRLSGLPSATSPRASADLHIEGYSETIEYNRHQITFNTSPAEFNQVWQLQVAGRSELGLTTRLGY